jgi:hypothetical protein
VHNAFGQSWAGILREGYARDFPDERLFNLARSGWAGMQRNSVFPWSGDINRSWSGYQAQVPVSNGEYPGQPVFRYVWLRVAAPPAAIYFDEKPVPAEGYAYNPATHELEVHFLMNAGVTVSMRGLKILTAPASDAAPETLTLEAPDNRSFGPDGTTLHYARHAPSSAAAAGAQLLIRNAQGQPVRTLPLNAAPGSYALAWDAHNAAGQPVPPGVYTAEVAGQHQRLIVTR